MALPNAHGCVRTCTRVNMAALVHGGGLLHTSRTNPCIHSLYRHRVRRLRRGIDANLSSPVFKPPSGIVTEKAGRAGESGRLMILYSSAAAVEKHSVEDRHGNWPKQDENPRRDKNWHMCCGATRALVGIALDIGRGRKVESDRRGQFSIAVCCKVVKAKTLALEGEEEPAARR